MFLSLMKNSMGRKWMIKKLWLRKNCQKPFYFICLQKMFNLNSNITIHNKGYLQVKE